MKNMREGVVVDECFCCEKETQLTVLKTSLFFAGDGFAVYDSKGQVLFRVDSYGPDAREKDQLVLMDAAGKCLLTVRRKVRHTLSLLSHTPPERVNSPSPENLETGF